MSTPKEKKEMNSLMSAAVDGIKKYVDLVHGGNVAAAKREFGMEGKNTLDTWLNGERNPGLSKVGPILEKIGAKIVFPATIKRVSPLAPIEDIVGPDIEPIPVYEQAGAGAEVDFFASEPERVIYVLSRYALPGVSAIEVTGDSMEPTIKKGAFVGVVPASGELEEGHVYLIRRRYMGLVVKRVIVNEKGELVLSSDNRRYPDQPIPKEDSEGIVIGKVVWVWQGV